MILRIIIQYDYSEIEIQEKVILRQIKYCGKKEVKEKAIEVAHWESEKNDKWRRNKIRRKLIEKITEMNRIQKNIKVILEDEKQSKTQLINAFKTLGYDIEL